MASRLLCLVVIFSSGYLQTEARRTRLPGRFKSGVKNFFRPGGSVWWQPTHEKHCTPACGHSEHKLISKVCMQKKEGILARKAKQVSDDMCASSSSPKPKTCEDLSQCEWQIADVKSGFCGWADVNCYDKSKARRTSSKRWCEKKSGVKESDYRLKFAMKCDDEQKKKSIKDVCLVTVNAPDYERALDVGEQIGSASSIRSRRHGCDGADVVVVATQELTDWTGKFGSKMKEFEELLQSGDRLLNDYVSVGRCGSEISAGVFVLVKKDKQHLFGPQKRACFLARKGFRPGEKGTSVLELMYVGGKFVAASSHLERGGSDSEVRLQQFQDAAELIASLHPSVVMWGGDFNMRTHFRGSYDVEQVLKYGLTHPGDGNPCPHAGADCNDMYRHWRGDYDPHKAFKALQAKEDYFGGSPYELETVSDMLRKMNEQFNGLNLRQLSVKHLCPTYYKAKTGPGTWKLKGATQTDDSRVLVGPNAPDAATPLFEWRPNFACKACPDCEEEYYLTEYTSASSSLSKNSWEGSKNRAPTTTERLFVKTGARGRCDEVKKISAETDHDAVYARCTIYP